MAPTREQPAQDARATLVSGAAILISYRRITSSTARSRARIVGAAALLVMLPCTVARAQNPQLWNEVDVAANWGRASVMVPVVVRSDTRRSNTSLFGSGLTLDLRLPFQTTITAGVLAVDLPKRPHSSVRVPLVAISNALHLGRILVADRNRVERLMEFGTSPVRYRNRFALDAPLDAGGVVHAFGDYEQFYEFSAHRWTQYRSRVGVGFHLRPQAELDLYYLQRGSSGTVTHVIGTTLKLTLNHASKHEDMQ